MSPPTLVSVITPTFNRADYLGETIQSVLDQTHPHIQHIVVNDGSTDGTAAVLEGFGDAIQAVQQENSGEPASVNQGFGLAEGELVGVVNDDDPVEPTLLEEMVALFDSDPDLLVAYPDWAMIDPEGERLQVIRVHEYDYLDMVRWHYCMPGPGTFFRRRVLDEVGGRDERFRLVGDFEFWLRVGRLGPFRRLPRVLATWRAHPGAATIAVKGLRMAEEHRAIKEKLFAGEDLPPELLAIRDQAMASAAYAAALACCEGSPVEAARLFLHSLRLAPLLFLSLPPNFRPTRWVPFRTFLRALGALVPGARGASGEEG